VIQKTFSLRKEDALTDRKWFVVDASGQVLGRLATRVATVLRGKHKPIYTPHVDAGDHVIVINAEQVRLTGNKLADKTYYRHSGYPGGIKAQTAEEILRKHPERVIEKAVKGMLPKNPLGRAMFKKLKVYAGSSHKHEAQKPQPLEI
jgi:large subunit ribosomal protein L13